MSAMDYSAGPDIRWYLSLAITAIPSPLSIAALVGNGKIVDDLDDDDSDNLLRDAVGDATLGVEPETASWRPYGSARGKKKAVGGEIQDFTLENVVSMKRTVWRTLVAAERPVKCLACGLGVTKQAGANAIVANDEATFFLLEGDANPLPVTFSNTDVTKCQLTIAVRNYKVYHAA